VFSEGEKGQHPGALAGLHQDEGYEPRSLKQLRSNGHGTDLIHLLHWAAAGRGNTETNGAQPQQDEEDHSAAAGQRPNPAGVDASAPPPRPNQPLV